MKIHYIGLGIVSLLAPLTVFAQTLPTPSSSDTWDISQGTTVTAVSQLRYSESDPRDMFGGAFSGEPFETGNSIFTNSMPQNTVHSVTWKTARPMSLESFRLFAHHDFSRPINCPCDFPDARVHGFRTFRLFVKNSSGNFQKIYEFEPTLIADRFQNNLTNTQPHRGEPFLHEAAFPTPIAGQEFRAEFTQFGDPNDQTLISIWQNQAGPRIVELDGFGEMVSPEPEPIILVPGLLASFNRKLMLKDQPGGNWRFPFGGNIYRGLISKFEQKGFIQNQKLFIAHYDWRQPNTESAQEYLKPMIDHAKQVSGRDKVDIVAHSMGGLVTRAYIQSAGYENDIDQVITLGTPNEGASNAYIAWEGGRYPDGWELPTRNHINRIETAMLENSNKNLSRPLSFREFFPSLKELLPVTPFVKKNGANITLTESNQFLIQLKNATSIFLTKIKLTAIAGTNLNTLQNINVTSQRTPEDIALERWRDGHPSPEKPPADTTLGDETVILGSALLGENKMTLPNINHIALPEKAQKEVLTALEIPDPEPPIFQYKEPKVITGWVVLSPIDITITGPDGKVISKNKNDYGTENAEYDDDPNDPNDPKVITLLDPPAGQYDVKLTGTGTGEYSVITTYTDADETISTVREGTTVAGKQESTAVIIGDGSIIAPPEDILALTEKLQNLINTLYKEKRRETKALAKLNTSANQLYSKTKSYQKLVEKQKMDTKKGKKIRLAVQQAFDEFKTEFSVQSNSNQLGQETIKVISSYKQGLENGGL